MTIARLLTRRRMSRLVVAMAAASGAFGALPAGASTLALTDTIVSTATDSYAMTTAAGQDPTQYAAVDPTLAYTLSGNQFNGNGQIATPVVFGAAATGTGGPWNFQDSYDFSMLGSAQTSSAVISIGSSIPAGLTNLQVRIINGGATGASYVTAATPQLGTPPNGVVAGDGWTTYSFANGSYAFTLPAALYAGNNYILQVRGDATTAASSSYGGTVTNVSFTPVPLPASLPMLLSGLVALGVAARRRRVA